MSERVCACGCGAEIVPSERWPNARFRRGHNMRTEFRPEWRQRAGSSRSERLTVPAAPIQRLLIERAGTVGAAGRLVQRALGWTRGSAYCLVAYRERLARPTAEALLRYLGDLPREAPKQRKTQAERGGPPVPAAPIGDLINQWARAFDAFEKAIQILDERSGVSSRHIDRIARARVRAVSTDVADRLCLAMGRHLSEVA